MERTRDVLEGEVASLKEELRNAVRHGTQRLDE